MPSPTKKIILSFLVDTRVFFSPKLAQLNLHYIRPHRCDLDVIYMNIVTLKRVSLFFFKTPLLR